MLAANGQSLPYDGWVGAKVTLPDNSDPNLSMRVPFLVSSVPIDLPLIGFNVIEQLIAGPDKNAPLIPTIVSLLNGAMGLQEYKATTLANFIQTKLINDDYVSQSALKVEQRDVVIPAGQVKHVTCKVLTTFDLSSTLVLFEPSESSPQLQLLDVGDSLLQVYQAKVPYVRIPIGNHMRHDVTLPHQTALGSIEPISKIVQTDEQEQPSANVAGEDNSPKSLNNSRYEKSTKIPQWDPPVDVSHLSKEQQKIVKDMLREESGAFSQDDKDMGCIPSLEMSITLKDSTPIQKSYTSIPKPLYKEVKEYIEDLLVRGWIVKSKSPYSSPVVCVDYCLLNQRTVPDRHPLPRIQDLTDTLGG